jgi:DHA2 family lincomycin resistance protein-like MFS transporter
MLVAVYIGGFLTSFNGNVVSIAIPSIVADMGVEASVAQWLVSGYMMIQAIVIAFFAFLTKRFTTKQLFLAASGLFAVCQLGCSIAPSYLVLLVFRLLQACGGGLFFPIMTVAVLDLAPRKKLGTYLSWGTACILLGPALAPVISGFMVTSFSWRAVFVMPGILAVLLTPLGIKAVKPLSATEKVSIDALSVALVVAALSTFILSIGCIIGEPIKGTGLLAISVCTSGIFVWRQKGLLQPVLNVKPMQNIVFFAACLIFTVAVMENFSMSLLLPMYFSDLFSMESTIVGLFLVPPILSMSVTTLLAGRLMDKYGAWPLIPIGVFAIVVGQIIVGISFAQLSVIGIAAAVLIYGGAGLVQAPIQTVALTTLKHDERASGTSLLNVLRPCAAAIGPPLFVSILSNSLNSALATGMEYRAAQAYSFTMTVTVAAAIAFAGTIITIILARKVRKQ